MQTGSYATQWREYRHRRNFVILLFVTYIPVAGGLCFLLDRMFHPRSEWAFAFIAGSWLAVLAGAWIWYLLWPCPRCRKHYQAHWEVSPLRFLSNIRGRHCF